MSIPDDYTVVRDGVGLFDQSGLTKIFISGPDSEPFLDDLITGSIEMIEEAMGENTIFLREDGTIVAIVLLFRAEEDFIIFTDREKRAILLKWLKEHKKDLDVQIEDKTDALKVLSIHGPKARELAIDVAGEDIIAIPYLGFEHNELTDALLFRVGYTGEFEFRFVFPPERGDEVMNLIVEKGADYDIVKCENEILDTLMVEMKTINQNKDIEDDTTPLHAGLHWMIDFGKDRFVGKQAVTEQKTALDKKLVVLSSGSLGKTPARANVYIEDEVVGYVINRCFSKTLDKHLALAYIQEQFGWVGVEFEIESVEGPKSPSRVVSAPTFVTKSITNEV